MEGSKLDQKYYEPGTTTLEVQSLENNELLNTTTPSITESLTNAIENVAITEKIPITTTSLPNNSTADIFRYMKGTVYDNIQHLWRSKLFEQKLASTRISVNTQPPPTTTTTITSTHVSRIIKNLSSKSQATVIEASTKHNLKNYSNSFSHLTFNLMKSSQNRNLTTLSLNKGVNRFLHVFNNSYDIINNTSTSKINSKIFSSHHQTNHYNIETDISTLQPLTSNCNCSRAYQSSFFEEYTNVWKLSFFVLAFVIGFVSLFLLLSLIFKVLIMHFKKFNFSGARTYKLQNGKSQSKKTEVVKVSAISLFEADSDNYLSNDRRKGKDQNGKKPSKKKTKTQTRRKSKASHKSKGKNDRLYGISNKAFTDSSSKFKEHKEYMLPFDMTSNGGLFNSFVKEDAHSSFRPFSKSYSNNASSQRISTNQSEENISCSISLSNINIDNKNQKASEIKDGIRRDEYPTYQPPWKQCNDYEALETTTATGSVTNLSSITSLSEAINKHGNGYIKQNSPMIITNNNNNELISRSSKITEELEMKLKERRMLTECSSDDIDTKSINNEKRQQNSPNEDEDRESPNKCSCPCHCHHDVKKNKNCQAIRTKSHNNINNLNNQITNCSNNYNKHQMSTSSSSYHHRQMVIAEDNIQTTDENSPTFTPLKRESIRKLMQNKAVSANKQKNELERHLTSMIISRINSCEIND